MQALYNLIHSLAKEEKRLYNLHGKKSRFSHIYDKYIQAPEFNKLLDRKIYQKYYSSFSKAFYSMQKNALLEDVLAVLLEYSNSSDPRFKLSRLVGKADVLIHKGYYDLAKGYLKDAIKVAKSNGMIKDYSLLLDKYASIIPHTTSGDWEEYEGVLQQKKTSGLILDSIFPVEEFSRRIFVLIKSTHKPNSDFEKYKSLAIESLEKLKELSTEVESLSMTQNLVLCETEFSKTFEDKERLHKRLLDLEEVYNHKKSSPEIRFQLVNLLLESSLDCSDFSTVGTLIGNANKELPKFPQDVQDVHYPKYLELKGMHLFLGNALPEAKKVFTELIQKNPPSPEDGINYYHHLFGLSIAANEPKEGLEYLYEQGKKYPDHTQTIAYRIREVIAFIDIGKKEEALVKIQRLRTQIRKSESPRKLAHFRNFLDLLQKHLLDRKLTLEAISGLDADWKQLLKFNLWIESKVKQSCYYEGIVNAWQSRKAVVKL